MNTFDYKHYRERKSHGTEAFPYTTYLCTIPLDFTSVSAHWHDEMEIVYIKKGQGLVVVDFEQFHVSAGSILFILPGQVHSIEQAEQFSMEYENILFKTDMLLAKETDACNVNYFLPLLNGSLRIPTHFTKETGHYSEIAACIDGADEICKTNPPAYQLAIKGQLFLLFYTLFSGCATTDSPYKDTKSLEKMKKVIPYIEQNYMEKITIEDIANELGLSQSHFMKFFKNTTGITFIDYLNEYRLTMAAKLLVSSDLPILDIAVDVGFENLSYFNRLFKKRFAMTPRDYRKKAVGTS